MSGTFTLRVITPLKTFEREITYLRLGDLSGHYGIMRGHAAFLSVLRPSLGYYTDAKGAEVFFAGALSADIEKRMREAGESEALSAKMLEGMERMFLEKTLEFLR
jgi:F0F1-type ATP synthase epsilon subunit